MRCLTKVLSKHLKQSTLKTYVKDPEQECSRSKNFFHLPFAATVVFLSNIGPVKLEPSSADFEILHMWDSPGPRLDIEIRGHFAPIPQKSFEYSPGIT